MAGLPQNNLTRIYRNVGQSEDPPEWFKTEEGFYGYWDFDDQPYDVAGSALWGIVSAVDHEGTVVYACGGAGNIPDLGLLSFRQQGEVIREAVAERAVEIAADANYHRRKQGRELLPDWVDEVYAYLLDGVFKCLE